MQMILFISLIIAIILLSLMIFLRVEKRHDHPSGPLSREQLKKREAHILRERFANRFNRNVEQDQAEADKKAKKDAGETENDASENTIPPELQEFKLINEDNQHPWQSEKLLTMTKNIKRPKSLLTQLTLSTYDPKEFATIVSSDAVIAAKILRTVNSSAFNLTHKITNIQHAVVYLGAAMVKNLAMEITVQDSFEIKDTEIKAAFRKFWIAGFIGSALSLRMAQIFNLESPSSLATEALLSFIGNLVILSENPGNVDEYLENTSLFARTLWEQRYMHANSALIGGVLAENWNLPDKLIRSIHHGLVPMAVPPEECIIDDLRSVVLCYACCRIGDLVAFHDLDDIGHVDFREMDGLEYYFLPEYLEKTHFDRFHWHLHNRKLRSEMNKMITMVKGYS